MLARIKELKEKHNVVILAHYYQEPEIQDIADFVGAVSYTHLTLPTICSV